MLRLLDLFSGIGGFSLGLERTNGFKTVAFCEIDSFCRQVLKKHWPKVPCYEDIRELTAKRLRADGISVDAICGGFPCQDISFAGRGAGIEGERSGLWSEYSRIIGELRPHYVIVENVAALLGRGLDRVLGDLAALGFDAEWHCIPASAVGAPHRRDRLWIVAHAKSAQRRQNSSSRGRIQGAKRVSQGEESSGGFGASYQDLANAAFNGRHAWWQGDEPKITRGGKSGRGRVGANDMADSDEAGLEGWTKTIRAKKERRENPRYTGARFGSLWGNAQWDSEPDVGRVANGVPSRVDRLKSLGNAVVPQIPELIGRAILAREAA